MRLISRNPYWIGSLKFPFCGGECSPDCFLTADGRNSEIIAVCAVILRLLFKNQIAVLLFQGFIEKRSILLPCVLWRKKKRSKTVLSLYRVGGEKTTVWTLFLFPLWSERTILLIFLEGKLIFFLNKWVHTRNQIRNLFAPFSDVLLDL